jgi:glucose/arabinose dehydrogenase
MKRSFVILAVLILCATAAFFGQERRGGGIYNRPASTMDSSPKMFDTKEYKIRVVTIAENLVYPYCFTFLPDGSALVVESEGRLRIVKDGKLQPETITGLPQVYYVGGQAGLMDVALHPKFAQNHLIYFTYNKPGEKGATMAIGRGKLEANQLTEVKDVFVAEAWGKANGHLSARMAFDRDGMMYMALADHNLLEDVQKGTSHAGKVLKMRDDGTPPAKSIFGEGFRSEIYTVGHRNPHALVLDPKTSDFWEVEHGDEINVVKAGANYGWPWVTSGEGDPIGPPPAGAKLTGPYFQQFPVWNISGLTIYNGDKFPKWKGNIFVGGLSTQRIERVVPGTGQAASHEPLFMNLGQRVRDVRTGPDGYIYFTTDDPKGRFMRVEPVAAVNAN